MISVMSMKMKKWRNESNGNVINGNNGNVGEAMINDMKYEYSNQYNNTEENINILLLNKWSGIKMACSNNLIKYNINH